MADHGTGGHHSSGAARLCALPPATRATSAQEKVRLGSAAPGLKGSACVPRSMADHGAGGHCGAGLPGAPTGGQHRGTDLRQVPRELARGSHEGALPRSPWDHQECEYTSCFDMRS